MVWGKFNKNGVEVRISATHKSPSPRIAAGDGPSVSHHDALGHLGLGILLHEREHRAGAGLGATGAIDVELIGPRLAANELEGGEYLAVGLVDADKFVTMTFSELLEPLAMLT